MLRCTDNLPLELYTAAQVRALDARIINDFGVPGIQLMLKASRALFSTFETQWPDCDALQVFCGKGNNAGDAYLMAALAVERGYTVRLWQVGDAPSAGDALTARERAEAAGVVAKPWRGELPDAGVIVDGLLGTGLKGDVRPAFAEAINAINASGLPVLAVDVPSGLCSDSGRILGAAVRASVTVSFIGLKQGLFTADAAECVGHLYFSDLEAPDAAMSDPPSVKRLLLECQHEVLPARARTAHKGHCGHVLVVGGDEGMAGAIVLAASAAARSGAGLVSCATRSAHLPGLLASRPEVMGHGVESVSALASLLAKASVVVIGPGLGQQRWGRALLSEVLKSDLPVVLDADALNLLGAKPELQRRAATIMTPHPGEAARLLDCTTADIHRDRFAAAAKLREITGASVLLKGAGTVIADDQGLAVSHYGNPGMASGGMGDVLSGVLGALLAQGLCASDSLRLGVCAHGVAADAAAALGGERGMLASDVIEQLRGVLNG
ncbi:NAD(P)H-hydrate epimerase [Litorivivens lipolytica]|uniref:Bifunctional NAD(P)H-hydrate repair enzyme n=1 Tax=Litorivivens lipolytica TaxID=1524264 RepID=A0A7W4Z801_9GAMM|nr:NAD(P)H-hydrate dehydratase [Litorivivens lipolytica]MBB3048530.1 NAD(P)H-hydrate epimerase [Litorivivens lipolytica]